MDINKRLEALKLSSSDTENSTDDTINERFCVVDFFKKGSAGQDVFATAIVPFLSLDDLVNGSACCRAMNSFCHTYTVGEIVSLHSMDHISGRHKTELGKFIFGFVSPSFSSHRSHHRRIHQEIDSFWDRLYHPVLVPEIELGMAAYFNQHGIEFDAALMNDYDWDVITDANKPTLLNATYGLETNGKTDVTMILRFLLMKQGNNRLILKPPNNGPRYWYNYLFGDPCYKQTKMLWIKTRSVNGNVEENLNIIFSEDESINMALRAVRPGDEGEWNDQPYRSIMYWGDFSSDDEEEEHDM